MKHNSERIIFTGNDQPIEYQLPYIPAVLNKNHYLNSEASKLFIPNLEDCKAIWQRYSVPEHIQRHCLEVANIVAHLTEIAIAQGSKICKNTTIAGALLHDLAKIYTIDFGGAHTQLGAAFALESTKNHKIAQIVFHHAYWPWSIDLNNDAYLPCLFLIYADKRVMHDQIVSLDERVADLLKRYGHTEHVRSIILKAHEQGKNIEASLLKKTEVNFNEYSFNSRRLV